MAYLITTRFRIEADHKPLTWLINGKRSQKRISSKQHVRDRENEILDALPRSAINRQLLAEAIPVNRVNPNNIVYNRQRNDDLVRMVCSSLQAKINWEKGSPAQEDLLSIWDRLHTENNKLTISM